MRQSNLETKIVDEVIEKLIDYRGKTPQKTLSGIKLITAKVIKQGRILDGEHEYIASENYDSWMKRGLPKRGDILITTEAPLGEVAQLKTDEKIALAQRVILLRGKRDVIDQNYFFFSLQSPFVQAELASKATGTTVSGIKQSELRQVKIPCFPLLTQRRIAAILSAYDELIENNSRRIKILEEMARMIYQEWFVKFRFPGHKQAKFVESPLGMIPAGWEVVPLGELYETGSGGTPSRKNNEFYNGDINWVKTGELKDSFIFDTEEKITGIGLKSSSAKVYPEKTVLIAMYGATIGQLGILTQPSTTNQACCSLVPKTQEYNYIFAYLTLLERRKELVQLSMGAAQQNINQIVIKNFSCLKPPKKLVQEFLEIINFHFELIKKLRKKNLVLIRTRDMLLPKLISGEIDVSDLDIPIEER